MTPTDRPARISKMAVATSNSTSVKPERLFRIAMGVSLGKSPAPVWYIPMGRKAKRFETGNARDVIRAGNAAQRWLRE
jgi:hypothetical protein